MTWNERYPKELQPTMDDIAEYSGGFKPIRLDLLAYFDTAYKCKPKMTYSVCSGMPGRNLKLQKSNTAFGARYPQQGAFDTMFVWSYKLDHEMMLLLPTLGKVAAEKIERAEDFMKNGRRLMMHMDTAEIVSDYKRMCAVKKAPIVPIV